MLVGGETLGVEVAVVERGQRVVDREERGEEEIGEETLSKLFSGLLGS